MNDHEAFDAAEVYVIALNGGAPTTDWTETAEWAYGNTRKATEGDKSHGRVIEDADYIAVRSCFCSCARCKHFYSKNEAIQEDVL